MQAAERRESGDKQMVARGLALAPDPLDPRDLRQIIREASRALAFLDAVRLEELALSCRKLTRDLDSPASPALVHQARRAAPDMAVFARVLEATRANLDVMRRLRDLRQSNLEFNAPEALHGHD